MRFRTASLRCAILGVVALSAGQWAAADAPTLKDMVTAGITDLEAKVKIEKSVPAELQKINHDYALAYSLRDVTMRFCEPGKLRIDNPIGCIIYNGPKRCFRVKAIGLNQKDSLGESPGQRHSLLDVGLLSPGVEAVLNGTFVRNEDLAGVPTAVFDVTYKGDGTARYRLWFDLKTHVVRQREWYDDKGKLRARFIFSDLKEVTPGIWTPTRLEVQNSEGKTAAVAAYSSVTVNQGLDSSLFEIQ